MPRVPIGTFTIELRDNDGNLVESQTVENKITNYGYNAILPITVHQGEILTMIPGECPDCKDGYYYPLIGKREPCETCN